MEITIEYRANDLLKGLAYIPKESPKKVIVFIHGLGDHYGRYTDWGNRFSDAGYVFMGVDLPGSGTSSGKRGHIDSFNTFHRIIDMLIDKADDSFPGIPLVVFHVQDYI